MKASVPRRAVTFRLRTDLLERLKQLAARENRSLNNYVECILMEAVYNVSNYATITAKKEAQEDAELYAYMEANFPEGKEFVSEEEKEAFIKRHGIGKYRAKR